MNAAVVDFNPALRNAQHAFDQWRRSRTQRGLTPLALRQCAVALLEQHCAFHICRALRINANALKQWAGAKAVSGIAHAERPADADRLAGFVRLPEVDDAVAEPAPGMVGTLIIELPNEAVIRVRRAFRCCRSFWYLASCQFDKSICDN